MSSTRIDVELVYWLHSLPGTYQDRTIIGLLEQAHAASKIDSTISEFTEALKRRGHVPQQRGKLGGYFWILALPASPRAVVNANPNYVHDESF